MHLRLAIDVAKQTAGLRVGHVSLFVDPHSAHQRHVEHQSAVCYRQTSDVVAATLHGEQQILLPRELNARDHVGHAEALCHQRRLPVDHRVPELAGSLVPLVIRC